jgi:hypothetical protein
MNFIDCEVAKIADQVCNFCKLQNFKICTVECSQISEAIETWKEDHCRLQWSEGKGILNLQVLTEHQSPKLLFFLFHMYILEIPLHFTSVRQWRGIRHVPCSLNAASETTIHCTIPWLAELCAAVNMNWEINQHFAARWIDFPSHLHIRFCVPLLQLCIHHQRNKTTWQHCLLPLTDTTELAWDQKLRFKKMKLFKDHFFSTKHGFCFIPDSASNKELSHPCIDRQGDQILLVLLTPKCLALPQTANSETSPHMV